MIAAARLAESSDVDELARLYGDLAEEQRAIRPIWPYADGLSEPIAASFDALFVRLDAVVVIGEIDDVAFGFLVGIEEALLPPLNDHRIGVIQLIFTSQDARGVGVGAAMLGLAMERFEDRGIDLFDARVSPGHRLAKNFFEANGFKARAITMHRGEATFGQLPAERPVR